jgi:hypothetical protein
MYSVFQFQPDWGASDRVTVMRPIASVVSVFIMQYVLPFPVACYYLLSRRQTIYFVSTGGMRATLHIWSAFDRAHQTVVHVLHQEVSWLT